MRRPDLGQFSPLKVKIYHKSQDFQRFRQLSHRKGSKRQILSLLQMQTRWMRKKIPTQPSKPQCVAGGYSKKGGGGTLRNQISHFHANPHPKANGGETKKFRMRRMSRSREGQKDLK